VKEIHIPARSLPVAHEVDLVVVGGGPSGIATAVAAARHGAKVVLLERFPSVGGAATNAMVNIWHVSDRTKQVIAGLTQELIDRCGDGVHALPGFPTRFETHEFAPHVMRVAMHDLLDDAGVTTICHLAAMEPIIEENRIKGVLADTKTGRKAFLGKFVVDATGDGDVAAAAGLPYEFGRESDGRVQGMTMIYNVSGLDAAEVAAHPEEADRVLQLMKDLRDRGEFPQFFEAAAHSYLRRARDPGVSYNMCPVAGNPLDELELTRCSAQARRQVLQYVDLWRKEMPGFQNAKVTQMAFWLGIREGRRVKGLETLSAEDVVAARKRPDAVGHGFFCVDIHDPKGGGHSTWVESERTPPMGESYHIPLGMCLNDQISNLAVAGRCASSTHEGHGSVRLQSHCITMGQGLGTAIALALDSGVELASADLAKLQSILRNDGAYIEDVPAA
jgi:ribulose 1,5-bisphosphate synthetase/thiazole synthase